MNYSDLVKDFAQRTLDNYENYHGNYKVTQLINSMIGLLIFPKEEYFQNHNRKIRDTLINPDLLDRMRNTVLENTQDGKDMGSPHLFRIVQHMRNAVSHCGISFNADDPEAERIKSVQFIDDYTYNSVHKAFKMTVSIDLLKEFLTEFANAIINLK